MKIATFGAGCFWGVEDAFRQVEGVVATEVGYSGGTTENPTYHDVCTDQTGHAEVVRVKYDPDKVSYETLLDVFWNTHDPTTLNRQGGDVGASYRSAIFYTSDAQKQIAEDTIADVDASSLWPGKAVTEIAPAGAFWEAEPEHQDYLQRYPGGYTCHFVRPGWKLPVWEGARKAS